VSETPDATLEEIREQLPVNVCNETVAAALRKLKLVYKKNN
jgi:transposase